MFGRHGNFSGIKMSKDFILSDSYAAVDDTAFKYATFAVKLICILVAIAILFVSRYAFVFFVASMLPTIVAVAVDRNAHKCASATVCSFNLIGVLPYVVQLWQSLSINSAAKHIVSDITTWLVVYGASTVGALLYLALPIVVGRVFVMRNEIKIKQLNSTIDDLSLEWGIPLDDHDKNSL